MLEQIIQGMAMQGLTLAAGIRRFSQCHTHHVDLDDKQLHHLYTNPLYLKCRREVSMKNIEMIQLLQQLDHVGIFVFSARDMAKFLWPEPPKTVESTLRRMVNAGILRHACKGIYVNPQSRHHNRYVIEHIARKIRQGEFSYLSLESMLSEYGVISQIPVSRMTVMTTGRSGVHKTVYGEIEFTHTARSPYQVLQRSYSAPGAPLRRALKNIAAEDLRRVGRNTHLIIEEELAA